MRELLALAWPIMAAMLGETMLGLVDTKLVGGLGSSALAGVAMATTLMYLLYAFVFGFMRGVQVCVSHAVGEGRSSDMDAYARGGVAVGLIFGVVVAVACRDVSVVLRALGAAPEVVVAGRDFLAAVTFGAPATCALAALVNHRQALGDSRTPMIVGLAGNVFNAVVGYGLIYGHFGLPALGVEGSGYATAIAETLELAALASVVVSEARRGESSKTGSPLSVSRAAREIASIGLPVGSQSSVETLAFATFTALLASMPAEQIAGHHVALTVIRVSFLPGNAIAEAACVLVGQALGQRDIRRADLVVRNALVIAIGFMTACGVTLAIFGRSIARFFSSDEGAVKVAGTLLFVTVFYQLADAANMVFRASLRGAKDVRIVAVLGAIIVWVSIPTCAYVLGTRAGLGALGGWIGFLTETTIGAVVFGLRWNRGKWRVQYAK